MENKLSAGRDYYLFTAIFFGLNLLVFFIHLFIGETTGSYNVPAILVYLRASLIVQAILYPLTLMLFFIYRYEVKHLVTGAAVLAYLLVFLLYMQQGGLVSRAVSDITEVVFYILIITYSVLMLRGKIALERKLTMAEPWSSTIAFSLVGLAMQIIGILSMGFQANPLIVLGIPGFFLESSAFAFCAQPNYAVRGYNVPPACNILVMLLSAVLIAAIIGFLVGSVKIKEGKSPQNQK